MTLHIPPSTILLHHEEPCAEWVKVIPPLAPLDPVTQILIPPSRLVKVRISKVVKFYDIMTLKWVVATQSTPREPLTNIPLTLKQIGLIKNACGHRSDSTAQFCQEMDRALGIRHRHRRNRKRRPQISEAERQQIQEAERAFYWEDRANQSTIKNKQRRRSRFYSRCNRDRWMVGGGRRRITEGENNNETPSPCWGRRRHYGKDRKKRRYKKNQKKPRNHRHHRSPHSRGGR